MEAKKYFTHSVTKHTFKTGYNYEKYSPHYAKIIILITLLIISYKVCFSEDAGYLKLINGKANIAFADSNGVDSNKVESTKCFGPVIGHGSNSKDSISTSIADTLNSLARQNKIMADSMINSYFEGIDAADSTFRINKSIKSGTFFITIVASPLISVFPVAVASAIHPSAKQLHIDASKFNDAAYVKGYKYQAHYIKKRKLWECFIEGGTPWCILTAFLLL